MMQSQVVLASHWLTFSLVLRVDCFSSHTFETSRISFVVFFPQSKHYPVHNKKESMKKLIAPRF